MNIGPTPTEAALLGRISVLQEALIAILQTHPKRQEVIKNLVATSYGLTTQIADRRHDPIFGDFVSGVQEATTAISEGVGH